MKKVLSVVAISGVLALSAVAVNSGLAKGESVSPFHPDHIAGPLANTSNCFPCTFQNRPQVQVWVHGDAHTNVMALAQRLNDYMGKYTKAEFKGLIVVVTAPDKVASTKAELKAALAQAPFKKVGVAVLASNNEAVENYKFNLDNSVKNTVYVYKNWKVTDKMVNLTANAKGLAALDTAVQAIVK